MKRFAVSFLAATCIFVGIVLVGCGQHEDQQHPPGDAADHGHTHVAPHGGMLVELGDHYATLEFLHNAEEGRLTLHLLDGHAENPIRLTESEIVVEISKGEEDFSLPLQAREGTLTGESVGDTSEFSAVSPELVGASEFEGRIEKLSVRGKTFENIKFEYHAD